MAQYWVLQYTALSLWKPRLSWAVESWANFPKNLFLSFPKSQYLRRRPQRTLRVCLERRIVTVVPSDECPVALDNQLSKTTCRNIMIAVNLNLVPRKNIKNKQSASSRRCRYYSTKMCVCVCVWI